MSLNQKTDLSDTLMYQLRNFAVAFIIGIYVFEFCLAWYGLTHL